MALGGKRHAAGADAKHQQGGCDNLDGPSHGPVLLKKIAVKIVAMSCLADLPILSKRGRKEIQQIGPLLA
jgi:hypothetical protein